MLCSDLSSVCSPLSPGLEPLGEPGVGEAEGDGSSDEPGQPVVPSDLAVQHVNGLEQGSVVTLVFTSTSIIAFLYKCDQSFLVIRSKYLDHNSYLEVELVAWLDAPSPRPGPCEATQDLFVIPGGS